jgi:hypothetical protein
VLVHGYPGRSRPGQGETGVMLLKHRPPGIDPAPARLRAGLEHLEPSAVAVVRWLNVNKVDYVLVGPVAHAIRGDRDAKGPVAIVLAPYSRNFERLTRALVAEHAGLRSDRGTPGSSERSAAVAVKLTAEKLARGRRWMLRFGAYDLDLEGAGTRTPASFAHEPHPPAREVPHGPPTGPATSGPRYQELLYEANRFTLAEGVTVEVAALEDLEHFSHVRRTGSAPEFRVTRNVPTVPTDTADATDGAETDAEVAAPPVTEAFAGETGDAVTQEQASSPDGRDDPPSAGAGGSSAA